MKNITAKIYTDGACAGNPGPGGWGALILLKSKTSKDKVTVKGGEKHTTNNRMELIAVIEALKFMNKNLKEYDYKIKIHSDSSYVVNSVNSGSLSKWAFNGWKTTRDTDVINRDLWEKLIRLMDKMRPQFIKVTGHSTDKFNNYVDDIAVKERIKYEKLLDTL